MRKGTNHGNADGLSRMLCGGKHCICKPVQLLETRRGGEDNHEVIYDEERASAEESEQYLLPPKQADEILQEKLKNRPKVRKKNRCVDFM